MDKTELLKALHTLTSNNVSREENLVSRYKGYRGELHFENLLKETNRDYFEGGIIASKDSKVSSLENAIYVTVTSDFSEDYKHIYEKLSGLNFQEMFLVHYNSENWIDVFEMKFKDKVFHLSIPEMRVLKYDPSANRFHNLSGLDSISGLFKNKPHAMSASYSTSEAANNWLIDHLSPFKYAQLLNLYMSRIIVDGMLGFTTYRGMISDIDYISKKNGSYQLLEVKEKYLAKEIKGFGIDIHRIEDFQTIQNKTGLDYHYVVRETYSKHDPRFKRWNHITINDFIKFTKNQKPVEGGKGMRSEKSSNPTIICDYANFIKF